MKKGHGRPARHGHGDDPACPDTDAAQVAHKRVTSTPYDRGQRYKEGDWFVHARFGVGQVKRVTPEGAIDVLFEDGSTKKMLHSQSG